VSQRKEEIKEKKEGKETGEKEVTEKDKRQSENDGHDDDEDKGFFDVDLFVNVMVEETEGFKGQK